MAAYLIRRLWQMIPTLAGVVLLVFFLFKYFGGDPAEVLGGLNASKEQIDAIRQELGLDQPVWVQLGPADRRVRPQSSRHRERMAQHRYPDSAGR